MRSHPLFETGELRIIRIAHASDVCVVTFSPYVHGREAGSAGFGEAFLDRRQIDAIHVIARGNDWYQYPDMQAVLARIRQAIGPGRRIVTYGSSMGGYAAIRFAAALGAETAIAISPQYGLGEELAPFEHRWRDEARRIRFLPWPDDPAPPRAILFYDPHGPDLLHARRWGATRPIIPVPLPYAGHPAGAFLAQTGLLAPAVLDILAGHFDAAALLREARARRRRSGQYFAMLSKAQKLCRPRLKIRLMQQAVRLAPGSSLYASRLGILLYRAGRDTEAEAAHQAALALAPDDPIFLFRYSRFLQRLGRYRDALPLAQRAAVLHPTPGLRRHARNLARTAHPWHPIGWWHHLRNLVFHHFTRLAWRRAWPMIGRLETP